LRRADLGIAFDGDGDRIALVDNEGVALTPEEAVWTLLQSYGDGLAGSRFVHDVKLSDRIREAARDLGAEPLMERTGHGFLRARMHQTQALFGAEVSGHFFFRELGGGDDGLLAACRVIAHLDATGQTLAEVRRACPAVFITPDLRVSAAHDARDRAVEQIRQAWAEHPQTTIDGIRIDLPGGWALVRHSVTEPALTFRFESADWHGVEDLVERFCAILPELGPQLWSSYKAAMGQQVESV
jgi:phosphomannomutase